MLRYSPQQQMDIHLLPCRHHARVVTTQPAESRNTTQRQTNKSVFCGNETQPNLVQHATRVYYFRKIDLDFLLPRGKLSRPRDIE
jgi:hypothetical protein